MHIYKWKCSLFSTTLSVICMINPYPSLTSPTTAQLLWDEEEIGMEGKKDEEVKAEVTEEGEVEELDYDECMEDLDLHPTGNIDEGEGGDARQLNAKSEERQG